MNIALTHFFLQFFVVFLLQINGEKGNFYIQTCNFSFNNYVTENRISKQHFLPLLYEDGPEKDRVYSPDGFSFDSQLLQGTTGIENCVWFKCFPPFSVQRHEMRFICFPSFFKNIDLKAKYYLQYNIFLDSNDECLKLFSSNFLQLIPAEVHYMMGNESKSKNAFIEGLPTDRPSNRRIVTSFKRYIAAVKAMLSID